MKDGVGSNDYGSPCIIYKNKGIAFGPENWEMTVSKFYKRNKDYHYSKVYRFLLPEEFLE